MLHKALLRNTPIHPNSCAPPSLPCFCQRPCWKHSRANFKSTRLTAKSTGTETDINLQDVTAEAAETVLDTQYAAFLLMYISLRKFAMHARQLSVAIADENYNLAAKLRDDSKTLLEMLPPVPQYLFHQVEVLHSGTLEEKLRAISALGEAGDETVLPDLGTLLLSPEAALHEPTQAAMWTIFMRHKDPLINEMMAEGTHAMLRNTEPEKEKALQIFDQLIRRDPSFAEAYNKRATVLYMMSRWQESIEDCKRVLELNPHHFGAASGMGLCYVNLNQYDEALQAFQKALAINPGLHTIMKFVEDLKRKMQEK